MDFTKWGEELQKNIPVFLIFLSMSSMVIIAVWKMVKGTFDRIEKKMDSILSKGDQINILSSNFSKYQEVLHVLKGEDSIFIIFDTEIDTTISLLSQNFSNGSSVEKAENDIDACRSRLMEALQNKTDLPFKSHYVVLVDVIYEKLSKLIASLAALEDYSVKGKLIAPYGQALFQMINYFGIAMEKRYPELSEVQVRNDLSNRFREYGTRLPHSRISTI